MIEWRHLDQRHTENYEGTFEIAFSRLAAVGTEGCARQQPLAAIRRALAEQPSDAGFRREGADLVVIVISAGDDGSVDAVADHVELLKGLAPDRHVFVAGVYPSPAPPIEPKVTSHAAQTWLPHRQRGLPDLHVGVITANGDGQMRGQGPVTGAFLSGVSAIKGTRTRKLHGHARPGVSRVRAETYLGPHGSSPRPPGCRATFGVIECVVAPPSGQNP